MDLISLVGKLVDSNIQIAESQIATLNYLGYHRYRRKIVEDLELQMKSLLSFVEVTENTFVQDVEAMSETFLGASATARDTIIDLQKRTSDDFELKEMVKLATKSHLQVTKKLAHVEKITEDVIAVRFAGIKKKIQNLLSIIENLPRK